MKKLVNGELVEMTPEEEAQFAHEMASLPKPEPDPDAEWKRMIEAALLEIGSILGGA